MAPINPPDQDEAPDEAPTEQPVQPNPLMHTTHDRSAPARFDALDGLMAASIQSTISPASFSYSVLAYGNFRTTVPRDENGRVVPNRRDREMWEFRHSWMDAGDIGMGIEQERALMAHSRGDRDRELVDAYGHRVLPLTREGVYGRLFTKYQYPDEPGVVWNGADGPEFQPDNMFDYVRREAERQRRLGQ